MPAHDRAVDWQAATRAALLRARTDDGHWEGRLSTSALSTATARIALASPHAAPPTRLRSRRTRGRLRSRPSLRSRPAARRSRRGVARRPRQHRRRLGRHAGQPLEHLDHRARLGCAQRRARNASHRRRGAEGRSVADLRRRRRRRQLAAARARRALRRRPHLLGADPHGAGDRRAPAIAGGTSRSCRSSWRRRRTSCSRRCGCRW